MALGIVMVFREPLEAKEACTFSLQDEIDEIVDFTGSTSRWRLQKGLVQTLHNTMHFSALVIRLRYN